MKNIFKRWAVTDGIAGETLPERFFLRRDAEELRDAIEFLYVLDGIRSDVPIDQEHFSLIEVVRA